MVGVIGKLKQAFGGTDNRPPEAVIDGRTYWPLRPLEERLAAWRALLDSQPQRKAIYEHVAATVDRDAYAALQGKYRAEVEGNEERHFTKYLDIAPWFSYHSRLAALLDIDRRPPCDILDIGSGGGHFGAIALVYGHRVTVMDLPDPPIYGDLIDLFGINRVEGGVYLGESLPEPVGRYDLIVINGQVFDILPKTRERWDVPEWVSFIAYLTENHLRQPGELFIGLNKTVFTQDSEDYLWPLVDVAAAHGASIERDRATMHFKLEAPLRFDDIAHSPWKGLAQGRAVEAGRQ